MEASAKKGKFPEVDHEFSALYSSHTRLDDSPGALRAGVSPVAF
jgi:hypothetical protein